MSEWAQAGGWAAAFVALVAACGFFTGLAVTLVAIRRFRLRYGPQHEGGPRVRRTLALFDNTQRVQAVSIIGSTAAGVFALVAAIFVARFVFEGAGKPLDWMTAALALVVALPILLVFGEFVPQRLFRKLDNRVIFALYHPVRWTLKTMGFLGDAALALVRGTIRQRGMRELPADALVPGEPWQSLLEPAPEANSAATANEGAEAEMIHGVFHLETTRVREVMQPLVDLVVVRLPERVGAVRELARRTGYSRFPVYVDRITD